MKQRTKEPVSAATARGHVVHTENEVIGMGIGAEGILTKYKFWNEKENNEIDLCSHCAGEDDK
jgi:hypothetical protein